MNLNRNRFDALKLLSDFSSDGDYDSDLEYEPKECAKVVLSLPNQTNSANPTNQTNQTSLIGVYDVSLEFLNPKPTCIKIRSKRNISRKGYDEMDNLPKDFLDAIRKKQNLTLKQILVLMNLHAIPPMILNDIHENLQTKVKRKYVKILGFRNFYVSQYNWSDLKKIQKMINLMLES